jgi:hypothetical protein
MKKSVLGLMIFVRDGYKEAISNLFIIFKEIQYGN